MERVLDAHGRTVSAAHVVRPFSIESPFGGLDFTLLLDVRDPAVTSDERNALSDRIVAIGCRLAAIRGFECSAWDDSIDWANLEQFGFARIPPDRFVRTSWHTDESLEEVVDFVAQCGYANAVTPTRFLVVGLGGGAADYEDCKARATVRFSLAFA